MARRRTIPDGLSKEHIVAALNRIDRSGYHPHGDSTHYVVLHNGNTYPPLAVLAFALEAMGFTERIEAGELAGGKSESSFRVLKDLGFEPIEIKQAAQRLHQDGLRRAAERLVSGIDLSKVPQGNATPKKYTYAETRVERNLQVYAYSLARAEGRCELCKKPGPFISNRTALRYLEVHHIKPLSQGGADTVENTIALCPNCHRECHHGTHNPLERFTRKATTSHSTQ